MKINKKILVKRNKNIIAKEIDSKVYLLSPENGCIYTLNETTSFIWDCLKQPLSLEEIVFLLKEEFEVNEKTAFKDVRDFFSNIRKENLFTIANQ